MDKNKILIIVVLVVIVVIVFYKSKTKTILPIGNDETLPVIVPSNSAPVTVPENTSIQITPDNASEIRAAAIEVANSYTDSKNKNDAIAIANQATAVINAEIAKIGQLTPEQIAEKARTDAIGAGITERANIAYAVATNPMYNSDGTLAVYDTNGVNIRDRVGIEVPSNQQQPINTVVIPAPLAWVPPADIRFDPIANPNEYIDPEDYQSDAYRYSHR